MPAGSTKSPFVPSVGKTGVPTPAEVVPHLIAHGFVPVFKKLVKFTWSLVLSSISTTEWAELVTARATVGPALR